MAARQQGNKKTTMKMKRSLQKKRQAAAKQQKRAKKQKKRQPPEAGSRPVLSIPSARMFAAKILRQMPKVRMETKARGLMKTMLMDVYAHMAKEMESLMQNKESPTLDPAEVQAVLKDAMTRELEKHLPAPEGVETAAA